MKLVVTDGATLSGGGVSLDGFRRFGELVVYDLTAPEQLAERVGDADAVLCNKTPIPAELFDQCPNLRYVGECATGYNNIDIAAAKAHGVTVCNVGGYSTDAVAQHTFALIAGIFFLVQFIRLRRPYQLLLAIGILASLLIHVGDPHNKVWFNTIGLFELVILVGAVVLSVAARVKAKKAAKDTPEDANGAAEPADGTEKTE